MMFGMFQYPEWYPVDYPVIAPPMNELYRRDRATRTESEWETRAMETSFSGFPYDYYVRPYVDSSIANDRSLEGPIEPNFLFPEEELFPEHELQAVERGEVVSPLGRHEALMYAIRNFEEEPPINVQNATTYPSTIFDNELAIPQGWDDDIMMRSISSCPTNFPEQYYSELLQNADASTVNMGLPDVNESDTIINQPFGLILKEEEQNTVDIKEDVISEITDNNKMMTDIKVKSEQETKEKELKCPSSNILPVSREINERNTNIRKKNQNAKGKRKKKENSIAIINKKVKLEEQEDVDVETVPKEEVPVLEAVDATSLLEKFEASQNSNPRNKLVIKNNRTYDTRSNKPCQVTQECRISVSEKSVSQASTLQKGARNSLSQDVLDKIKASGRKKTIPVIPAMPNIQGGNRRNSVRTQNRAPRNKILKTSSTVTNNAKSSTFSNTSVQLDHDYCSSLPNFSVHTKSCNNNKTTKPISIQKSSQNKDSSIIEERQNSLTSNVYYNLKPVNGINRKAHKLAALQDKTMKDNLLENNHEDCQKETFLKQSHDSSNLSVVKNIKSNESSTFSATLQMPIRSALANRILQSNGMLPKTNIVQTNYKTQRMISVLKNPPNASQSPLSTNNSNENIVTTTNSLNNVIQNTNVQSTQNTLLEVKLHEEVKTDLSRRVKISFEEYRIRKTSNKSPTQIPDPTEVVHIYTATTMTELIIKDDGNVEIWCVRDIFPVIKKKSEIEAEKNKPKPPTCDAEAQTNETMFEFSTNAVTDVMEKDEKKEESTKKEEQESCKKLSRSLSRSRSKDKSRNKTSRSRSRSKSRSRSRSRSRSKSRSRRRSRSRSRSRDRKRNRSYSKSKSRSRSRSKSRTRSRNRNRSRNINTRSRSTTRSRSRNRSRSRSRRRSNTRRRTISHRRSSVSSTSSYSSRSPYSTKYSHSRSSSRSRNRSRSRSISRSRFTRQHYSSHSRNYNSRSPPSSNNFGRNRWSNHRERNPSDLERPYMYERSYSFVTTNHYRSRSRSPLRPYHKPYEYTYNKVKKKEIDERRVLYVGRINEGITKTDLRRRFEAFGPIVDVSLHFRERGDNYGFVTFEYRNDAFEAKEHGNDNPSLPRYDICFGGRRAFCNSTYADLDDMRSNTPRLSQGNEETSFDYLLMQAKSMMKENKRKA